MVEDGRSTGTRGSERGAGSGSDETCAPIDVSMLETLESVAFPTTTAMAAADDEKGVECGCGQMEGG